MYEPFEDSPADVIPNTNQHIDKAVESLQIETAWSKTTGTGIVVAVLDTGTVSHPNIDPNIRARIGNPDTNGHATHVTGIIGAAAGIANGIRGIAYESHILSIQVLPGDGSSIATGIATATKLGADIINMSLGAYGDDQALHDACKAAYDAGVILVAAAGNTSPTETAYPARYPEVIAVSALDENAHQAWFAPDLHDTMLPNHFAMPGINIVSCWLNGQYAKLSGTSQACPILAGIIALILAEQKGKPGDPHNLVQSELSRISRTVPGTTFKEPEGNLL